MTERQLVQAISVLRVWQGRLERAESVHISGEERVLVRRDDYGALVRDLATLADGLTLALSERAIEVTS